MRLKKRLRAIGVTLTLGLGAQSSQAWAWGETGHNTVCNVAVFLVKNPELQAFLRRRGEIVGHLCNIPDISWRNIPSAASGDAAHFMNPQNLGMNADEVPLDFGALVTKFEGKVYVNTRFPEYNSPKVVHVHETLGSNWWRTNQLYQRAIFFGKGAVYEQSKTKDDLPYNVFESAAPSNKDLAALSMSSPVTYDIYQMLVNMGVMGHFVGDASMPLHNFSNYDGWVNGHGGVHSYYESAVVDELNFPSTGTPPGTLPQDLRSMVYQRAQELLTEANQYPVLSDTLPVLERIKALSVIASTDAAELFQLDQTTAPSTVKPNPKGGADLRTPAQRPTAAEAAPTFKPLIVKEMALSALTLAKMWDEIYAASGAVPFGLYRSFLYPLDVDFIAPDYADGKDHPILP